MSFNPVFLSLGSNMGLKKENLEFALKRLSEKVTLEKVSGFYHTAPIGPDQDFFLNLAARGTTDLNPEELLRFARGIELERGRTSGPVWGPRILDIDLLLMGSAVCKTPHLTLPHPQMTRRRFVLEPLFEIAGNLSLPQGKTLLYYLNQSLEQSCEKVVF